MRSLWKGAISFGLVNIPINMYTATENRDVRFHFLHAACSTPIQYRKYCPHCQEELEQKDLVRGYQHDRNHYVIVTDEDFDQLPLEGTRAVEILDFVDLAEIDPLYFNKSYYLEPTEGGTKPYALLRKAMDETGKIAIAKVVLRTKEHLAAVRVHDQALVMETMFYPDEIRPTETLRITDTPNLKEQEINMAVELVAKLSDAFHPEKYENEYREALLALIHAKIEGKEVAAAPAAPAGGKVIDLMSALEASLNAANGNAKNGRTATKGKQADTGDKTNGRAGTDKSATKRDRAKKKAAPTTG